MSQQEKTETTHLTSDSQSFQSTQWNNGTNERNFLYSLSELDHIWPSTGNSTSNKPNVTTNLRNVEEMINNPPKDRHNLVYILMMIHGIAVLIPWNMFINAKDYFENYKLDNGNRSSTTLLDYKTNFMSYIGMASQYPCFIMNFINLFIQCKGNTVGLRILASIIVTVIMFVVTVILAVTDTSSWSEEFFWITIISAVVINAAVGLYQNSIFGIVAVLPMKYTNAVIFGNNISGTLVAVTNIIVLVFSPSKKTSAIYCFLVAIVILVVAFDAYFITSRCKFYRHYLELSELEKLQYQKSSVGRKPSYKMLFQSYGRVFKKIYHLLFGVWFSFFVTLALFPAVMSDVKPLTVQLSGEYWTAIFCFLCYNLFATFGNLTTEFIQWPKARWINIIVVLRLCFAPIMILGNFRPELRNLPVYLPYDSVFIVSAILFSFTSGYCSSLVMMYAPKCVAPNDSANAGMVMALFLVFGVLCGINFSRVWGIVIGSG
uniref:Equilibrative nucleoside transporter 1 n=3 Tax=Arion vulgaris TaxID=1028688 RepID=A0A0B7AUL4_9EUPU